MLDNDALNLVSDVIKAIHGILQMLVDLAATDEVERIPAFDLLVEQFQASVVVSSASPSMRVICRQISLSAAAFFATSDSNATARCASSEQSTTAFAIFRMSGSKFVISNSMMAFAVALH